MTRITTLRNIEAGLYQEAFNRGTDDGSQHRMSGAEYLQLLANNGEIAGELFDPEAVDENGQPVSAVRQLLDAAGIITRGEHAMTINDAFFADPNNLVLFPLFIEDMWIDLNRKAEGLAGLDQIVSVKKGINARSFKIPYIENHEETAELDEHGLARVTEGSSFPKTVVKTSSVTGDLRKFGRELLYTYESLRNNGYTTEMMRNHLDIILQEEALKKMRLALAIALNGDGNSNPAINLLISAAGFDLEAYTRLRIKARRNKIRPEMLLGDDEELIKYLTLDIVVAANANTNGAEYRNTGEISTAQVLGFKPWLVPVGSILDNSKKVLTYNSTNGLWQYTENGSVLQEVETIINKQFKSIVISEYTSFCKPDPDSFMTMEHQ